MTPQELVLLAVVAVVGIPSAWRNPTAAALVLAWIVSKIIYLTTGNGLAVEYYLIPDIAVIATIFCKQEHCNLAPYGGDWHQLKCIFLERSPQDRVVLAIFPAMWVLYVAPLHPFYVWHGLWLGAIVQFLAAGAESVSLYRREADAVNSLPEHPGDLLIAYRGRGYG